jgi:hypothetical protein
MPPFDLSIVVAAQGSPEETANCLRSLLAQEGVDINRLQIIVSEVEPFNARRHWRATGGCTSIEFVESPDGYSIPLLHGIGMSAASAPLVTITEGHCTFSENWMAAALNAHQSSPDTSAIGGSVLPGNSLGSLNTALFLCDYAQFLPPLQRASTADLPGNNIVFKREVLPQPTELKSGFWKTFFCKQLEKDGKKLEIEPAMIVYYNRKLAAGEIAVRRYHHGRCFGGMRSNMISINKRCLIFLTGAALPAMLSWKLTSRCRGKGEYLNQLVACAPAAFLCLSMWALGEWIGNLAGPGHSCELL